MADWLDKLRADGTIPAGINHLKMIDRGGQVARSHITAIDMHNSDLTILGTSLSALYQAATCHRKCHGGGHVLEGLAGRAYNLACAAYQLTLLGFYDEAMNLTRSIGEITNLVWLSAVDSEAIRDWIGADDKTRRNKFSPVRIRERLKSAGIQAFADDDWYGDLCQRYVHVNPNTKPGAHDISNGIVGGVYQAKGLSDSLEKLAGMTSILALLVCRYFQFDDLLSEITRSAKDSSSQI